MRGAKMSKPNSYFRKRHNRFFRFFKWLLEPYFCRKFAFSYTAIPHIDGPCIVLANHNTDYDPILISFAYHKLMYFVTSEHVLRAGLASRALNYLFAPISRIKGSVASSTVMQILRRLRDGHTVCMFAEGNRSFDGNTGEILPATAKLIKSGNATLVTYRFSGGYFTSPRWSTHLRHGKLTGCPVHVYSPEAIKAMTTDEVYAAICADLQENAYARQMAEPVAYHGKRLAEALETMLFVCPQCKSIDTLQSHGAHLRCQCGLDITYSEMGGLSLPDLNTIPKWDAWQQTQLFRAADADDAFALSDGNVRLSGTNEDHQVTLLYTGSIRMTRHALTFGSLVFPAADIVSLALCGKNTMVFSVADRHYEVKSKTRYCARKYLLWYQRLKAQQV